VLLLAALVSDPARAMACDPTGADAGDIAGARADVANHCACDGSLSHRAYVRCSAQIVLTRVNDGQLSGTCRGIVQRAAAKSACGTPAAVTCCTLTASGRATCRIKRSEAACVPPAGGAACVGGFPSCSDACDAAGCVSQPPVPAPPPVTSCTGSCPIHTVFLILMENHDWSSISGSASAPYINGTLLPMASHAEKYFNPPGLHPSEPNYLWLEAGTNFGVLDDNVPVANHQSSSSHLVTLLDAAGLSWRAYEEGTSGIVCPLTDLGPYAVRHDPFVFFDDVTAINSAYASRCIDHVRPYAELRTDLGNDTVARYNFITPNVCNDMHDSCAPQNDPVRQGDDWLSAELPKILSSQAYANNGAVLITWDEGETGDGPIGMIAVSPRAKGGGYSNAVHYTHGSTLRTLQEIFGLTPLLGDAAGETDLSDLFITSP